MVPEKLFEIISVVLLLSAPVSYGAEDEVSPESPSSPVALLNRCYSHLTQRRLPLNHPLRIAVLQESPPSRHA